MNPQKIFVSCATQSELVFENWIRKFSNTIKLLLENYMNSNIDIVTSFDKNKTQFIEQADTILMVVSSGYYTDKNARKEIEQIQKLEKNTSKTIYKLIFTDNTETADKDELSAIPYNFYLENPFGQIDLSNQDDYVSEKSFWLKLVDFSMAVCPECNLNLKDSKHRVFIAETGPDMQDKKDALIRELQHNGYGVITVGQEKLTPDETKKQIEKACEEADIIVHIIGGVKARDADGEDIITLQNNIAAGHCEKTGKENRLIWIPEDLLIKDENQRLLIEKLKRDNTALPGAEIVQIPTETFKDILLHRLKEKENPIKLNGTKQNIAYLIYHPHQKNKIREIKAQFESENIRVIDTLIAENKKELLFHHWQSLIICNSVILLYNENYPEWLESKKKDIIKATGLGRKAPIMHRILLLEPGTKPDTKLKKEFEIVENKKEALNGLAKNLISKTEL